MAKKELKTNVMRVLDSKKLAYNHYAYDNSTVNGVEVARLLGQDPDRVFKTLVTRGKSGGFFVFTQTNDDLQEYGSRLEIILP